jgi:hypothetical protein
MGAFFAGLLAAFAVGTIWFDIVLFILFVIIATLVEKKNGFWATIVTIGSIVGINWLWKLNLVAQFKAHPLTCLEYVAYYFIAGIAWSLVKWAFFVHRYKVEYKDLKSKFLQTEKIKADQFDAAAASRLMEAARRRGVSTTPPAFIMHRNDLIRWACYWPFSFIGTMLSDIVVRAWEFVVNWLQSTYEAIAERIFRSVSEDVALAKQYDDEQAAKQKAQEEAARAKEASRFEGEELGPKSSRRGIRMEG